MFYNLSEMRFYFYIDDKIYFYEGMVQNEFKSRKI